MITYDDMKLALIAIEDMKKDISRLEGIIAKLRERIWELEKQKEGLCGTP